MTVVTHASIRKAALVAETAKGVTRLEYEVMAYALNGDRPYRGCLTVGSERRAEKALEALCKKLLVKRLVRGAYRWRLTALGDRVLKYKKAEEAKKLDKVRAREFEEASAIVALKRTNGER